MDAAARRLYDAAEKLPEMLKSAPLRKKLRHLSGSDCRDMGKFVVEV